MKVREAFSESYRHCVAVEKIKAGARRLVVADRDGSIQPFPQPVKYIPESELSAGKELREMTAEYPLIQSSAQVIERVADGNAYEVSVREYGLKRSRPKLVLPDGTVTNNPGDVPEWEHLHNPDIFLGFGSGIYLRYNGGYATDREFHKALGGDEWRPRFFEDLDKLKQKHPEIDFEGALGVVDKKHLQRNPDADVDPPDFRVQFDQFDEDERLKLWMAVLAAKLRGEGFENVEWADESNPQRRRFTSYAVSAFGQKHQMLERAGNGLSYASGVPMDELTFDPIGDSPTDLLSGLIAFQGAKEVNLVIAANSRLSNCIVNNKCSFAGVPLPGGPDHPTVPGRYYPTELPGVLWWKGVNQSRPRRVVVADHTPFAAGLGCTESVVMCLKYLWYGPSLRRP